MKTNLFVRISLVAILVAAQGCSLAGEEALLEFFKNLSIAAGRAQLTAAPCETIGMRILPGTCQLFPNPCTQDNNDQAWVRGDSFGFNAPPDWLTVETEDFVGLDRSRRRRICVAPSARGKAGGTFAFTYLAANGRFEGELMLALVTELRALNPTAMPATPLEVGQSTQLSIEVFGGQLPYRFAWVQSGPVSAIFNDPTIQSPIATITARPPGGIVTFTVTVTDEAGQFVVDQVAVRVLDPLRLRVSATATPSIITLGASSQLLATVEGGVPPFQFEWFSSDPSTPFSRFDPNPVVTPRASTDYHVSVRDSASGGAVADVTVIVIDVPFTFTLTVNKVGDQANGIVATQPPAAINCGLVCAAAIPEFTTVRLVPADAFSTGNFAGWSGCDFVDAFVACFVTMTSNRTVTAAFAAGGPTACFTYTNNTALQQISLDASCSTGGVVRYEWDFSFEPANPDLIRFVPLATWEYGFGSSGRITLTVFDALFTSTSTSLSFP